MTVTNSVWAIAMTRWGRLVEAVSVIAIALAIGPLADVASGDELAWSTATEMTLSAAATRGVSLMPGPDLLRPGQAPVSVGSPLVPTSSRACR